MANDGKQVKYDPPVTIQAGQIQFVEACHPPLVAGEYAVTAGQTIKESKEAVVPWNSDPYVSDLNFSVDAPRFTLSPGDMHSVYPPVNEEGKFDNALPHVVFTRRTLPWERTLDGTPPQFGKPFPTWLALLLLNDDELQALDNKGELKTLPIFSPAKDSLLRADSKDVLVPDLGQNAAAGQKEDQVIRRQNWEREKWQYQDEKKSCLSIDLPATLFKAIAPRDVDLPFLAHVRQVDTGNKEVLGINDRGWFSLVMGNRLPHADMRHRAFLVSLEGWQDLLPESWTPVANRKVRLAVLGSWVFICKGSNDFKAKMAALNIGPDSGLRLPYQPYKKEDSSTADSARDVVNAAYSRGYTAFDHAMRHGEKTVSWFRGPLVPLNYHQPAQIQKLVSCADDLLRYDPEIGMFDVSYAAAWQLGRLLALQNQAFALAVDRTRKALRAKAEWLVRQAELQQKKKSLGLPDGDRLEDSFVNYMANGGGQKLKQSVPE